jgi:hypothetical protein
LLKIIERKDIQAPKPDTSESNFQEICIVEKFMKRASPLPRRKSLYGKNGETNHWTREPASWNDSRHHPRIADQLPGVSAVSANAKEVACVQGGPAPAEKKIAAAYLCFLTYRISQQSPLLTFLNHRDFGLHPSEVRNQPNRLRGGDRSLSFVGSTLSSQVKLLITNNSFCIVHRATAESKTGFFVILV